MRIFILPFHKFRHLNPAKRLVLLSELSLSLIMGTGLLCLYYFVSSPTSVQASSLSHSAVSQTIKAAPAHTPSCQRGTSPMLSPLTITTASPGLTQRIDAPFRYQVYGSNTGEINRQMYNCTPVVIGTQMFAASTNYLINSQYDFLPVGNKCTVTHVAVGLHIDQIFPLWQPSATSSAALASNWQRFITNLTAHEHGHINLDIQYAELILHDLQALPATDCTTIDSQARQIFNLDLRALNQANNNYDAETNHGVTQGAVL